MVTVAEYSSVVFCAGGSEVDDVGSCLQYLFVGHFLFVCLLLRPITIRQRLMFFSFPVTNENLRSWYEYSSVTLFIILIEKPLR